MLPGLNLGVDVGIAVRDCVGVGEISVFIGVLVGVAVDGCGVFKEVCILVSIGSVFGGEPIHEIKEKIVHIKNNNISSFFILIINSHYFSFVSFNHSFGILVMGISTISGFSNIVFNILMLFAK